MKDARAIVGEKKFSAELAAAALARHQQRRIRAGGEAQKRARAIVRTRYQDRTSLISAATGEGTQESCAQRL